VEPAVSEKVIGVHDWLMAGSGIMNLGNTRVDKDALQTAVISVPEKQAPLNSMREFTASELGLSSCLIGSADPSACCAGTLVLTALPIRHLHFASVFESGNDVETNQRRQPRLSIPYQLTPDV
jgi:hypothetical protein